MQVIEDIEPTIQNLSPLAINFYKILKVQRLFKAIKFSRFTLGRIPPRIGGIKVYPGKVMYI